MDALKRSHLEDLQQQISAHKITLENAKQEVIRLKQDELNAEREKHHRETGVQYIVTIFSIICWV